MQQAIMNSHWFSAKRIDYTATIPQSKIKLIFDSSLYTREPLGAVHTCRQGAMIMDEYLVPTQFGEDEFYEKKSHFIGRAWPVETEEEAL